LNKWAERIKFNILNLGELAKSRQRYLLHTSSGSARTLNQSINRFILGLPQGFMTFCEIINLPVLDPDHDYFLFSESPEQC